jgi:hypothetical protein
MPEAFLSFPARSRERTVILTLPVMARTPAVGSKETARSAARWCLLRAPSAWGEAKRWTRPPGMAGARAPAGADPGFLSCALLDTSRRDRARAVAQGFLLARLAPAGSSP